MQRYARPSVCICLVKFMHYKNKTCDRDSLRYVLIMCVSQSTIVFLQVILLDWTAICGFAGTAPRNLNSALQPLP